MYRIYKIEDSIIIYYVLCNEDAAILKWFYMRENNAPSLIYIEGLTSLNVGFSRNVKECIYESSDLQEASDYLEQLRVL